MVSNWSQHQQAKTLRWEDLLDSLSTEVHLAVAVLVKCTVPPSWSCCIRSQHKRCPNGSRFCFHKNSLLHSDELLSDPCWFLNIQWFCSFFRDALSPEVFSWDPWLHLGLYWNVTFPNIFRMFYLKFQLSTAQVFQSPFPTFFFSLACSTWKMLLFLSCLLSVLSCTQSFCSFVPLLYPEHLKQCLEHRQYSSVNIEWMNEWTNEMEEGICGREWKRGARDPACDFTSRHALGCISF